ncbi:MAG: ankyrin repeat domain-containing protein [Xenococcaceae cyanobacterium MO_167.B52]|nr:ankyrin repeat domain-containing protein [Xenococcaceae cyanobacterium MO_167.B52]
MTITRKVRQTTEIWLQKQGYSVENLDEPRNNGATALIKASQEQAIDIVRDLLIQGVNINLKNNDGNNALWFACFRNNMDLMKLLIDAGIDLDNQNDNGVTVLMYAASSGKPKAVKFFLEAGANPNLKNLDDFRAIDFSNTVEILNLLRSVKGKS